MPLNLIRIDIKTPSRSVCLTPPPPLYNSRWRQRNRVEERRQTIQQKSRVAKTSDFCKAVFFCSLPPPYFVIDSRKFLVKCTWCIRPYRTYRYLSQPTQYKKNKKERKETIKKEKETSVAANPENEKEKKEKTPRSISYMSSLIEGMI